MLDALTWFTFSITITITISSFQCKWVVLFDILDLLSYDGALESFHLLQCMMYAACLDNAACTRMKRLRDAARGLGTFEMVLGSRGTVYLH